MLLRAIGQLISITIAGVLLAVLLFIAFDIASYLI